MFKLEATQIPYRLRLKCIEHYLWVKIEVPESELHLELSGDCIMYSSSRNELATEKVIWSIKNFNRIPPRDGFSFKSSIIHKRHARNAWRFDLYPSSYSDPNYMAAYFSKAFHLLDPIIYNCSLSIGGSDGNPVKSFEFHSRDLETHGVGGDRFIKKESIEKFLKGSVTLQCEITAVSLKWYFPSLLADFENLSSDLTALFNNPMYYDLTVRLQQSEFHLHTCVLYVRCRGLSRLFGYQSFNEMPKIIQIDNILPNLFHQLMYYLYSGKLEDFNFTLELFMFANHVELRSLKQCVYQKVQEYRTNTEIATQTLTITWNLNEIQFQKKDMVPFVQMFQIGCCLTHLVVRMGISEHFDGEKYIDVSFKVFMDASSKSVSLLCVMTLFFNCQVRAYEKASHNIDEDEEWHFPPFVKLSDITESNKDCVRSPEICLTAEISLSDGCRAYNNVHTKTRLFTNSPIIVYPQSLGDDMRRLLPSNVLSRFKNYDITLKSIDDIYIPAHMAILWTRWPASRDLMKIHNESATCLPLNLRSEEIQMLLDYIYTGYIPGLNHTIAEKLLQANAKMEYPPHIVNKCRDLYRRN